MKDRILKCIEAVEKDKQVRILYTLESGSRGWGFASLDSDYDVRFVYVHQPEHYLSLVPDRDVIELPLDGDLDINGWDLKKALLLFYRSNPTLYEWLDSPIVYIDRYHLAQTLRALIPNYFSSKACFGHYFSMLKKNYADCVHKEQVNLKKYFYVMRALLACEWLKVKKTMPPMVFESLLEKQHVHPEIREQLKILLEQKRSGEEQDLQARIPLLDDYVTRHIQFFAEDFKAMRGGEFMAIDPLNQLFRQMLAKAWERP